MVKNYLCPFLYFHRLLRFAAFTKNGDDSQYVFCENSFFCLFRNLGILRGDSVIHPLPEIAFCLFESFDPISQILFGQEIFTRTHECKIRQ